MFYALERKARRRTGQDTGVAALISVGYELGSDYGLSVVRPLLWLLGGIIVSTILLYFISFYGVDSVAPAGASPDLVLKAVDALEFSFRQAVLPFDALRVKSDVLNGYAFNPGGTGWLKVWGSVLTVFEVLSLLLLILAVRWRYRR